VFSYAWDRKLIAGGQAVDRHSPTGKTYCR
jgi:hypothetical protein